MLGKLAGFLHRQVQFTCPLLTGKQPLNYVDLAQKNAKHGSVRTRKEAAF